MIASSRAFLLLFATALSVGCTPSSQERPAASNAVRAEPGGFTAGHAQVVPGVRHALPAYLNHEGIRAPVGFADHADQGRLTYYPARRVSRLDGAYTWHRVDLSEAHARASIDSGTLRVTMPDGQDIAYGFVRRVDHANGDWTWVGHAVGGRSVDDVILTFGSRAVFGSIARPGRDRIELVMRDGVSWMVETDPSKIARIVNPATRPSAPDFLLPPDRVAVAAGSAQGASGDGAPAMAGAAATAANMVDVVLGYTPGFASYHGGASQAVTRLNFMVAVINEAYANSQVDANVRLVHAVQVDYPDATANSDALEALSGYKSGTGTVPVPAALQPLRAARDQYGGDLVSLVRRFNTPENDGCGIAWLIGGGRTTVDTGDAPFGYSVVSDGQDAGIDGKTYFCRQETLAHELGHNMGLQHDRDSADGDDNVLQNSEYGAFAYAFGYKSSAAAGNFYTVMAYGDTGQTSYRVFSNPRVTVCGGQPCGIAEAADNARALGATVPTVAQFRAMVVPLPPPPTPAVADVYVFAKQGASGRTELHRLAAANQYASWNLHVATVLEATPDDRSWKYLVGDYNRDGRPDLYAILRNGASNTTEVHVLDGATNFQSYLLNVATALHPTGRDDNWEFGLGDYDRNGSLDLYVISKNGASGTTEVHVLSGSTFYRTWLLNVASGLHPTPGENAWEFVIGDVERDGVPDVLAINRAASASGRVEVHALSGASRYAGFNLHVATPLDVVGTSNVWDFKSGDFDGDGRVDVFVMLRAGASNTTEIHVLDGAANFSAWKAHRATALHPTGADLRWDFGVG